MKTDNEFAVIIGGTVLATAIFILWAVLFTVTM